MVSTATKRTHTIVLDTGAIIRNHPTVSSLIAQAEELYTVPAIISEIKDATTRTRVETTLMPFLKIRTPTPASIAVITEFAKKTGDLAVLSRPDIQILALAYELECERNHGDWRLRRVPGQKGPNGVNLAIAAAAAKEAEGSNADGHTNVATNDEAADEKSADSTGVQEKTTTGLETQAANLDIGSDTAAKKMDAEHESPVLDDSESTAEDSDGEGWITPGNLDRHKATDAGVSSEVTETKPTVMQVATITTDFAMQNVLLRMNLNLLSSDMQRISQLKTYILRCHGCFQTTKEMDKQFCPRCGQPSLTRVACSTTSNGEFRLHLKKNMQWNHRGERFSIPKAVAGTANGRVTGGGKGHWGHELILAEDQKEYTRALTQEKREKVRDLMDQDYLPQILSGERYRNGSTGGRTKVGAGRNVNSKKR